MTVGHRHDVAAATAAAVVEMVAVLRPEERLEFHRQVYEAARAALAEYDALLCRQNPRLLKPSKN